MWSEPASAATAYSPDEQNNIDIYKAARDATVNITSTTYVQNWFMQVFPQKGTGSGFIINPDGQILTNNHVVQGAQQLTVKLADQKEYKAKVLARDPRISRHPDHGHRQFAGSQHSDGGQPDPSGRHDSDRRGHQSGQ